jgi:adenylate cyclase
MPHCGQRSGAGQRRLGLVGKRAAVVAARVDRPLLAEQNGGCLLGEESLIEEGVKRRLAAILAADVVGYSRLMGQDEAGTLSRLRAHRHELIDPQIAEHRGRIVKTTGDGLLVEFASVVDALRCAAVIQEEMAERNANTPAEEWIAFRVGIHQGDIIVEDGDIFGDGVNIAARLEGLADPGGICVSGRVQEDAAGKLELAFDDIGEQALKNIARPVRVSIASEQEHLSYIPPNWARPNPLHWPYLTSPQ